MPFGTATVVTNSGKAIAARRHIGASPAQAEPNYIAMGVGASGAARTAAATDVALSAEVESRVAGTSSATTTALPDDTYQTVGIITASASRQVDEAGTFDDSVGGDMDISATFSPISLNNGDSLQLTFKKQFL